MLKLEIVGSISEERTISHCSEIVDILKGLVPTNIYMGFQVKKNGADGLDWTADLIFVNFVTPPQYLSL